MGGSFSTLGGQARDNLARISSAQAALQSLNVISYSSGSSVINWSRGGSAPAIAQQPTLFFSTAGGTYSSSGKMYRVAGGWRAESYLPGVATLFNVRASAPAPSGLYGGSSSLIQSTRQFYVDGNEGIFNDGFD